MTNSQHGTILAMLAVIASLLATSELAAAAYAMFAVIFAIGALFAPRV